MARTVEESQIRWRRCYCRYCSAHIPYPWLQLLLICLAVSNASPTVDERPMVCCDRYNKCGGTMPSLFLSTKKPAPRLVTTSKFNPISKLLTSSLPLTCRSIFRNGILGLFCDSSFSVSPGATQTSQLPKARPNSIGRRRVACSSIRLYCLATACCRLTVPWWLGLRYYTYTLWINN